MRKALVLALIFVAVSSFGQSSTTTGSNVGGKYLAYNYGFWSVPVMFGNTVTGSQQITVKTALVDVGNNHIIMPFAVGTPLKIGTEIVTPTALTNCSLTLPDTLGLCKITATFTKTHNWQDSVSSGTYGLQEALNDAALHGGGIVLVDVSWAQRGGTQAMVSAATVAAGNYIQDARTPGTQSTVGLIFNGTPAIITSGCGTSPIITGGSLAGQFTIGVTSGCNPVITPGVAAPNGWACTARDITTPAATFAQTGSTLTTATFTQTGTSVSTDKVIFNCVEY
jgi:hypothetical protein